MKIKLNNLKKILDATSYALLSDIVKNSGATEMEVYNALAYMISKKNCEIYPIEEGLCFDTNDKEMDLADEFEIEPQFSMFSMIYEKVKKPEIGLEEIARKTNISIYELFTQLVLLKNIN